jgi:hypothetical protein
MVLALFLRQCLAVEGDHQSRLQAIKTFCHRHCKACTTHMTVLGQAKKSDKLKILDCTISALQPTPHP